MTEQTSGPIVGAIDSHQHFIDPARFYYYWMRPDRPVLHRSYLPNDLEPLLQQNGVARTIAVQAHPSLEEGDFLLELASSNRFIAGVVPSVDLTDPDVDEVLKRYADTPLVKAVRHQYVEDEVADFLLRKEVQRGLEKVARSGIPYDLLLRHRHLPSVPTVLRQVPGLKVVVEHIGKPPIASGEMEPWAGNIAAVAAIPGVYCKISGAVTEADHQKWTVDDLHPYVQHVVKVFGHDRIMWGSDWPVCLLAAGYDRVLSSTLEAIGPMTAEQRTAFLSGNASTFYGLG